MRIRFGHVLFLVVSLGFIVTAYFGKQHLIKQAHFQHIRQEHLDCKQRVEDAVAHLMEMETELRELTKAHRSLLEASGKKLSQTEHEKLISQGALTTSPDPGLICPTPELGGLDETEKTEIAGLTEEIEQIHRKLPNVWKYDQEIRWLREDIKKLKSKTPKSKGPK